MAFESTLKRIESIREESAKHYEEGNQAKCYSAVWRNYIRPQFGISYRTYLNYVKDTRVAAQ